MEEVKKVHYFQNFHLYCETELKTANSNPAHCLINFSGSRAPNCHRFIKHIIYTPPVDSTELKFLV